MRPTREFTLPARDGLALSCALFEADGASAVLRSEEHSLNSSHL